MPADLQQLTDGQVTNRLTAYNGDGSLDRDLATLWADGSDIILAAVAEHFGEAAIATVRAHYTSPVDAAWMQNVAEYGRRIYREQTSVPAYIIKRDAIAAATIAGFFERFGGDHEKLCRMVSALQRLTCIDTVRPATRSSPEGGFFRLPRTP